MLAPFERGRGHGGSQRATSIAERLEERGAEIEWKTVPSRSVTTGEKVVATLRRRPALLSFYDAVPPDHGQSPAAAIAEHPYLAPHLAGVAPNVAQVVDFQDLQSWHLRDLARVARGARRMYLMAQSRFMRRFEEAIVRSGSVCLFATQRELDWALSVDDACPALLIPNLLPIAELEAADRVLTSRRPDAPAEPALLYVGTLTYPPNVLSLREFLASDWPSIRASNPGVQLWIAGAASADDRRAFAAHPQVRVLGFVDDLGDLMANASAAVLPLIAGAGSSLRILLFAAAGLPVIGTPLAFRGFDEGMGWVARGPQDWASAVRELTARSEAASARTAEARRVVLDLHRDPRPWDDLFRAMFPGDEPAARRGGT